MTPTTAKVSLVLLNACNVDFSAAPGCSSGIAKGGLVQIYEHFT